MKSILLIGCGVCLQIFSLFGNSLPYAIVLETLSPNYHAARQAYDILVQEGSLEEGDTGFIELRRVYMRVGVVVKKPPIPMESIEGATIVRFHAGDPVDASSTNDSVPVIVTYSEGSEQITDFFALGKLISAMRSTSATAANLGILLLGVGLAYAGLRRWFLGTGSEQENVPPTAARLESQ